MGKDINNVYLTGTVSRIPEIISTKNGGQMMLFTLNVEEGKEDNIFTVYVDVVIFFAKIIQEAKAKIAKGSRLIVQGSISSRKSQNDEYSKMSVRLNSFDLLA